jgi:hypothetical protein
LERLVSLGACELAKNAEPAGKKLFRARPAHNRVHSKLTSAGRNGRSGWPVRLLKRTVTD